MRKRATKCSSGKCQAVLGCWNELEVYSLMNVHVQQFAVKKTQVLSKCIFTTKRQYDAVKSLQGGQSQVYTEHP